MKGLLQNSPSLIAGILEPQKFEYSRLLRTPNFKINSKKSGIFTNLLLKDVIIHVFLTSVQTGVEGLPEGRQFLWAFVPHLQGHSKQNVTAVSNCLTAFQAEFWKLQFYIVCLRVLLVRLERSLHCLPPVRPSTPSALSTKETWNIISEANSKMHVFF